MKHGQRRPRECQCGPPPERCLSDDEYVTQLTDRDGTFRSAPRVQREVDFSVQRGELTLAETFSNVLGDASPLPEDLQGNDVRYAQVGALREAGFVVIHTRGRVKNGTHVSIVWMGEDGEDVAVPWPPRVSEALDACFNETLATSDGTENA